MRAENESKKYEKIRFEDRRGRREWTRAEDQEDILAGEDKNKEDEGK
jgi:hypothetical protein